MNTHKLVVFISMFFLSAYIDYSSDTTEPQRNFRSTNFAVIEELDRLHEEARRFEEETRVDEAINTYEEIILIEPDDDAAYANLGRLYMATGNYERAENAFLNALHINDANELALTGLTKIHDPDNKRLLS